MQNFAFPVLTRALDTPRPMATPPAIAPCTQAPRLSLGGVCAKSSQMSVCHWCAMKQAALCLAVARLLAPFDLGEGEEGGGSHEAAVAQVSAAAQAAAAKWAGRSIGMRRGRTSPGEDASIVKKHLPSRASGSPTNSAPRSMALPSWGRRGRRRRAAAPAFSGDQSATDHITASAALGMPMGIQCHTQIWEVLAGPSSKLPSSEPRAWYFKFRIRQSFDPNQLLPVVQIRDILAAAMLVKLSRTAAIDDLQNLDAFRGFAAAVNALVEASHAGSSGECGYVVLLPLYAFVIKINLLILIRLKIRPIHHQLSNSGH